jgi:medium-chain acyl-[acyl-carrier-protein] hydrolase
MYSPGFPSVSVFAPNPAAKLRLLCFPFAGGGASVFSSWPRALPPEVEVCAAQMPGREGRLGEPAMRTWDGLVDRLVAAFEPWMDRPFVLFGYSLGAALAFEFACYLRRRRRPGLVHLVVCARRAPHVPREDPPTYHLPDAEFIEALRRISGTPEEVLQNPELREILFPLLRADFALSETYVYQEQAPLAVPISVYGGVGDELVAETYLDAWRVHTTGTFRRCMFPGTHFFLTENRSAVLAELTRELRHSLDVLALASSSAGDAAGAHRG